jgi:hypothetical protein
VAGVGVIGVLGGLVENLKDSSTLFVGCWEELSVAPSLA